MSRSRTLLLSLVLSLFAAFAQAASAPPNQATLQKVLDAWASMDLSKPAAFYAKDRGPFFDIAPRSWDNWAAYENGAREMFKTINSITFKFAGEPQIHRTGNTAWSSALVDGEIVMKDGSRMPVNARWTSVWEKRPSGKWLIVHDHFSMPLPEPAPKP